MLLYNSTYQLCYFRVFVLSCVEKNNIPHQSFNMVSGSSKNLLFSCCFRVVLIAGKGPHMCTMTSEEGGIHSPPRRYSMEPGREQ